MADIQIISESDNSEPTVLPETRPKVCAVCNQKAKYTCPKCSEDHCSTECYKKHNIECTEEFHKKLVIEELRLRKPSEKERRKFIKNIYEKFHSNDNTYVDAEEHKLEDIKVKRLKELFEGIDSEQVSSKSLTTDEEQMFKEFLNDKQILQSLFKPWVPYWFAIAPNSVPNLDIQEISENSKEESSTEKPSVEEVDKKMQDLQFEDIEATEEETEPEERRDPFFDLDDVDSPELRKAIRTLFENQLSLMELKAPSQVSPLVAYHLVNVVYAFTMTARMFNGSYVDNEMEFLDNFYQCCRVLKVKSLKPENASASINLVIEDSAKMLGAMIKPYEMICIDDLAKIFEHKYFTFLTLSYLKEFLQRGLGFCKKFAGAKLSNRFQRSLKKIEFLSAWVKQLPCTTLKSLSDEVRGVYAEKKQFQQESIHVEKLKDQLEAKKPKGPLIEELP